MSALESAKNLLNRLGHDVISGITKLGYQTFTCKRCQDSFFLDDSREYSYLYSNEMIRITSWQTIAQFNQHVYDDFARQALLFPHLYCLRLRVML